MEAYLPEIKHLKKSKRISYDISYKYKIDMNTVSKIVKSNQSNSIKSYYIFSSLKYPNYIFSLTTINYDNTKNYKTEYELYYRNRNYIIDDDIKTTLNPQELFNRELIGEEAFLL